MKILHIAKHCRDANGNVNAAIDLACPQAGAGHSVAFASEGGILEPLLARNGVLPVRIAQAGGVPTLLRNLVALVRFCRRWRPDVIHAHMVASALFGFVAAKLCGARLVTTVHNSFDRQSALMRVGDAVVAVSEAERRLLVSRGFDPARLACILNGPVGSVRETLEVEDVPFATPCVTMVCGLHARKGVADMLAAFAQVTRAHPDWHLNVVGEGPDREALAATIAEQGLTRAHLLGAVAHPKPCLERSAIFATCSHAEPFGLSTIEARAAGCAVIGSRVGGTPEALGEGGLLFEAGDRDALAALLDRLMGDPEALATCRERSRPPAGAFDVTRVARDHLALYEGLLATRRRGRAASRIAEPPARLRPVVRKP